MRTPCSSLQRGAWRCSGGATPLDAALVPRGGCGSQHLNSDTVSLHSADGCADTHPPLEPTPPLLPSPVMANPTPAFVVVLATVACWLRVGEARSVPSTRMAARRASPGRSARPQDRRSFATTRGPSAEGIFEQSAVSTLSRPAAQRNGSVHTFTQGRRLDTACDYTDYPLDLQPEFVQWLSCPNALGYVHSTRVDNPEGHALSLYHASGESCSTNVFPGDPSFVYQASLVSSSPVLVLFNSSCIDAAACCAVIACENPAVACNSLVVTTAFADPLPPQFCGYDFDTGIPALLSSSSLSLSSDLFLPDFSCIGIDSDEQNVLISNPAGSSISVALTTGEPCSSGVNIESGTYPYEDRVLSTTDAELVFIGSPCVTTSNDDACCAIVWCDAVNDAAGCIGLSVTQDYMPTNCFYSDQPVALGGEGSALWYLCNVDESSRGTTFTGQSTRVSNPNGLLLTVYHSSGDSCSMFPTNPLFDFDETVQSRAPIFSLFNTTCISSDPCCLILVCSEAAGCDGTSTTLTHTYYSDSADPPVAVWAEGECDIGAFGDETGIAVESIVTQSSSSFGCLATPLDTTVSATLFSYGDSVSAAIVTGATCLSGVDIESDSYVYVARELHSRTRIDFSNISCASRASEEDNCCLVVWCDAINGAGGCVEVGLNQQYQRTQALPSPQPGASQTSTPTQRLLASATPSGTPTPTGTPRTPAAASASNTPLIVGISVGVVGFLVLGGVGGYFAYRALAARAARKHAPKGVDALAVANPLSPAVRFDTAGGGGGSPASYGGSFGGTTWGSSSSGGSNGGAGLARVASGRAGSARRLAASDSAAAAMRAQRAASLSMLAVPARGGAAAAAVDYSSSEVRHLPVVLRPVPRKAAEEEP